MQITDEMVEVACLAYDAPGAGTHSDGMRAALEAALGQFILQYGDNIELKEAEQIGFAVPPPASKTSRHPSTDCWL